MENSPDAAGDVPITDLPSWDRDYYEPGGGDAFLYYVVFGEIDTRSSLSRSKYRTEGSPEELDVTSYGPGSHPEIPGSFREGSLWTGLQSSDPQLADSIARQDFCLILRGDFPDPDNLNYLRDTVGLIMYFLDHGGVGVFDTQMFKWWSPSQWRTRFFDVGVPDMRRYVSILFSEDEGGTEWFHTRGLRKFGRPDLSVPRVPPSQRDAVINMCNRYIMFLGRGGLIKEGEEIRMPSLPAGLICRHGGHLDDPDFNNVHVRIAPE
jgi:hypothetical protein